MSTAAVNKSTAFWLLASAILTGVIVLQINDELSLALPVTAASIEPDERQADGDSSRPVVGPPTDEWRDMIVERTLFSASRRSFTPPVKARKVVKADPERKPLTLTLSGTLLAGESKIALLSHPSHGLLRLRQGQTIDGWQVEKIWDNKVRLQRDAEVIDLSLRKDALSSIRRRPVSGHIRQNQ